MWDKQRAELRWQVDNMSTIDLCVCFPSLDNALTLIHFLKPYPLLQPLLAWPSTKCLYSSLHGGPPTMWLCEQILVPHRSSNAHIQFTRAFLLYSECIFICSPHIHSRWSQLTSVNTHRLTVAHTHFNRDISLTLQSGSIIPRVKSSLASWQRGGWWEVSRRYPVCLVIIMYTHADTHLRECRPARTAGELVQSDISASGWIL